MSYGLHFISPELRLRSDLAELHKELINNEIKERITPADFKKSRIAQKLALRYNVGIEDSAVKKELKRIEKQKVQTKVERFTGNELIPPSQSDYLVYQKRNVMAMNPTAALNLDKKREIPKVPMLYQTRIQVINSLHYEIC